jgi:TPR repeat protein
MTTIPSRLLAVLLLLASFCVSCSKKDNSDKIEDVRKAAEQGDAKAQRGLGFACYEGEGLAKDQVEAVKWWRKAAEQGDAEAQLGLGLAYSIGNGVAKNPVEAVKWWRKAAEQGNAKAQYMLGLHYDSGYVVPKSQVEAYAWFNLAAVTDEDAKETRAELEKEMTAQQVADGQKRSIELSALIKKK